MKFALDKVALGKAIGVLAMSWLALPVLYYMFCKRDKLAFASPKKEEKEENDKKG